MVAGFDVSPVVYDPFSVAFQEDPFPVYRRLRDEAPVYYNEKWNFWALSRYEDVRKYIVDHDTFLNHPGIDLDATNSQGGEGNLPNIDNPRHDQLRGVVQRLFMPRSIAALSDDIRAVTVDLVEKFARRGTADIAQELSWPLPYEVFFDFLGLPEGDERLQLIEWSHGLKDRLPDSDQLTPKAVSSTENSRAYLARLLAERRTRPKNDLLTHVVQSTIAGEPFAAEDIEPASEIVGLVFGLYLAGIETTAGLLSTLFHELATHPDQQRALRENPSLIPNAVEEGLRYRTPLQLTVRTATRDVTVHGVTIPEGSRVALVIGAANHDERQYENAHEYDALRPAVRHLGFGEGLHGCLGNPLARLEAKIALEVALPRLGRFELDGPPIRYPSTPNMAVLDHLPVAFAPLTLPSAAPAAPQPVGISTDLRQVVVQGRSEVADGVAAFTFAAVDGADLPEWEPGAHIDLVLDNGLTRQYSLCGDPSDRRTYRVAVLREPEGRGGSRYIHDELDIGSTVSIRGPRNHFKLEPSEKYIFIAGGIGITPILPMVDEVTEAGAEWTLIYGGRALSSMGFVDELAAHGGRVTTWPQDSHGIIDLDSVLGSPRERTLVYVCGPAPLLDAVEKRCATWPEGSLHLERFASKVLTAPVRDAPFEIELARSARTLLVPTDRSIVDVLEEVGINVLTSCNEGKCGTCDTDVLEGVPDHRDSLLSKAEQESGDRMMLCVSRSCTPKLVLDL